MLAYNSVEDWTSAKLKKIFGEGPEAVLCIIYMTFVCNSIKVHINIMSAELRENMVK